LNEKRKRVGNVEIGAGRTICLKGEFVEQARVNKKKGSLAVTNGG